jgi:hypothetical protein
MRASRTILAIGLALFLSSLLGCSSGNSSSANPSTTSTVSAYVTDDLAGYESVLMTVNTVQLQHMGGNRLCTIIPGPLTMDAAKLGRDQLLDLVNTTSCDAGPYNHLHIELDQNVTLVDASQQSQSCKFVSYLDDRGQPNALSCTNGTCSLDVTGAVNLVTGNHEHVALDADLKQFTVDTTKTPCEVTFKLSPLHAQGMDDKLAAGYRKSVNGTVSSLDTTADTFTLSQGGRQYAVQYSGVTDQPGLDTLLARAQADSLKTQVRCESFNTASTPPACTAQTTSNQLLKAVTVKAEGTVASLAAPTAPTFSLNYPTNKTLPVNYQKAVDLNRIEGTLTSGKTAEAALYGFATDYFLARDVEVKN